MGSDATIMTYLIRTGTEKFAGAFSGTFRAHTRAHACVLDGDQLIESAHVHAVLEIGHASKNPHLLGVMPTPQHLRLHQFLDHLLLTPNRDRLDGYLATGYPNAQLLSFFEFYLHGPLPILRSPTPSRLATA